MDVAWLGPRDRCSPASAPDGLLEEGRLADVTGVPAP